MFRSTLLILAGVLSSATLHAAASPQVIFLGDTLAQQWSQQADFKKHSNWFHLVNGNNGYSLGSAESSELSNLSQYIHSNPGKKPVIVIMTGEADSETTSPGNQHSSIFAIWAEGWEQIIATALKAGMPVILSTIPYSVIGDVSDMNKYILTYGVQHKIPVVNFDYALNALPPPTITTPSYYLDGQPSPAGGFPTQIYSTAGYDVLTDMLEVAVGTSAGRMAFKSGHLDTWINSNNEDAQSEQSQKDNVDGGRTQFVAYATYTDGSTHRVQNADIDGHFGTWLSSAPLVMSIDWNGRGIGGASGSTNIHFMDPQGHIFSSWTMNTEVYVFGCPLNPCAVY